MTRLNDAVPQCVAQIGQFFWSLSGFPGRMPDWLFNTIWSRVKESEGAAHLFNQPVATDSAFLEISGVDQSIHKLTWDA